MIVTIICWSYINFVKLSGSPVPAVMSFFSCFAFMSFLFCPGWPVGPTCPLWHVLAVLPLMSLPVFLSQLSCLLGSSRLTCQGCPVPDWPVKAVLSQTDLSRLPCHGCPATAVVSRLSWLAQPNKRKEETKTWLNIVKEEGKMAKNEGVSHFQATMANWWAIHIKEWQYPIKGARNSLCSICVEAGERDMHLSMLTCPGWLSWQTCPGWSQLSCPDC